MGDASKFDALRFMLDLLILRLMRKLACDILSKHDNLPCHSCTIFAVYLLEMGVYSYT
jgi:hypothetical protein